MLPICEDSVEFHFRELKIAEEQLEKQIEEYRSQSKNNESKQPRDVRVPQDFVERLSDVLDGVLKFKVCA